MRRITTLLGLTLIIAVVAAFSAAPAMANGCTPGFWKNRAVTLNLYNTNTTVGSVFANAGTFSGVTFLQALSYGGGPGVTGAKQILLRAAVAGYLNYVVQGPGVYWTQYSGGFGGDGEQFTVAEYQTLVGNALASTDRDAILALASHIDVKNNEHEDGSICS